MAITRAKFKDTITITFTPKIIDLNGDTIVVSPSATSVVLETFDRNPHQLKTYVPIENPDGSYTVDIYLDPSENSEIAPEKIFMVSFYWTYNTNEFVNREIIRVVNAE